MMDSILGHHGCARCLMALHRLDEAEVQWDSAIQRIPDNPEAFMGRATISDYRKDWAASEVRWKHVAETYDFGPGFAFRARALIELDRIDEAESYLVEPANAYPGDLEIAITRSHLAERRGDLNAACERWLRVRAVRPDYRAGYEEGARRLFEAGRYADADAVLQTAIERFPEQPWPLINYARHAHDCQDWREAAARWAVLRDRFPDQSDGYTLAAEALRAMGQEAEAATLTMK
jgi:predicted Zn-dependent protease